MRWPRLFYHRATSGRDFEITDRYPEVRMVEMDDVTLQIVT
jgi:hypothetical protein